MLWLPITFQEITEPFKRRNLTTNRILLQDERFKATEVFMSEEKQPIGSIHISSRAIATIAYQAARQSYGVVGLAPKNLVNELTQVVVKDPTLGVEVHYNGESINIDMYIIVEYGTRIKSVADSVSNTVRYLVEKTLGLPVNQIAIHIQGLRISDLD
jgi:uncharacterized alkaline shock family protein YloU